MKHNIQDKLDHAIDALRWCALNDSSHYEHHDPRPFDGKGPEPDGTIWFTPRQIALRALRALGQDVTELMKP